MFIGAEMHIDPALLSAMSALVGALIGGGASLTAAIYTQRYQDRLQRVARETTKRETVYADFIMNASKLLLESQCVVAVQARFFRLGQSADRPDPYKLHPSAWRHASGQDVSRGLLVTSLKCGIRTRGSPAVANDPQRPDCLAGHIGLELANPSARYLIGRT
jgi:hypothetical protein